jgi:hypothetical protein
MFAGRSMGKAFRPSRLMTDLEPMRETETSLEREVRIREYASKVRLHLPLFESQQARRRAERMAIGV